LPRRRKPLRAVEEIVERWYSGWLYHWLYKKAKPPELEEK
jgi:hypothetical protein